MIVVDLGCKTHESLDSIKALCDRFHPTILFGFDPHPQLQEGESIRYTNAPEHARPGGGAVYATTVLTKRAAAWTYDGVTRFAFDGTRSAIAADGTDAALVPCFNFARWLGLLPAGVVVKMDVEGAEYELIGRLITYGADLRIDTLLVEWHGDRPELSRKREVLSRRLRCKVEFWD